MDQHKEGKVEIWILDCEMLVFIRPVLPICGINLNHHLSCPNLSWFLASQFEILNENKNLLIAPENDRLALDCSQDVQAPPVYDSLHLNIVLSLEWFTMQKLAFTTHLT
jgi:hypothetical protein